MTSWPFIFATSSKKSRMPLRGSVDTCPATHRFGLVLMVRGLRRLRCDVQTRRLRFVCFQQVSLLFIAAQHEMGGRRQHALDGRKFFGNESGDLLQRSAAHEDEQIVAA